jgi:8-oxo-dGTP diphosphatase
LYRSVAGIAWEHGKFFIAQRPEGGSMGNKWEFPGGKVDGGESDQEALAREYREELGVNVAVGEFLGSAVFELRGVQRQLRAYRVFFAVPTCILREHSQWRWAAFEEIDQLDFVDSDRKLLPILKNKFSPTNSEQ